MSVDLSPACADRVARLFPNEEERQYVRTILVEICGPELVGRPNADPVSLDRVRYSVLKLSEGTLDKFDAAVELARTDWRDLFVAAGFAQDPGAHSSWEPG